MKINPSIFKAYDIRGVYKEDFDEEMAYKLGRAYGQLRKKELDKRNLNIVVGSDMRLSSPVLKEKLIEGLLDEGLTVVDIDLSSTPSFYFAVSYYSYDGGVLVSASHNPGQYNGFKMVRSKAVPLSGDTGILTLRDMVLENDFGEKISGGESIKKEGVLADQIKVRLKMANPENIKKMKIVIDPANAMGAQYFDELFKYLPCELVRINWDLDGTFPAHEADPLKPENMQELCAAVKKEKADLGISTDGDGDRIFFVDNEGEIVESGVTKAFLSKIFLEGNAGKKIGHDIRPGKITEDVIRENGGIPVPTKIGHSLIKEQALREDIFFSTEATGHFYFNMKDEGCYEVPTLITLKVLEELSRGEETMAEHANKYRKYFHSGEHNSIVDDPEKIMQNIKTKYSKGEINELDGIYIAFPEYWFSIRKSNTEPLLRLNLEAVDKKTMEEKRDEILNLINS
ncbi:phosphomannomutase/phosphoglucomutase [Candidatus Parcubacteria bacterium]|nr:MAG: phosphomannomutase/phosphoglucomutase [Candidatus Parcubacteria bacterium]